MFNCYHFNSITFNWLFGKFFHSILLKKKFHSNLLWIHIAYSREMLQRKFCLMKACVLHCWLPRYRLWKHTSAWCENISIYNTEYRSLYYSDIYVNINNLEEANLRQWNVSSDEGGKCSFGPLHIITFGILCRELKNGSSEICRFRVLDELSKADLLSVDCFI